MPRLWRPGRFQPQSAPFCRLRAELVCPREGCVYSDVFVLRTLASAASCAVISGPGTRVLSKYMYLLESICGLILEIRRFKTVF